MLRVLKIPESVKEAEDFVQQIGKFQKEQRRTKDRYSGKIKTLETESQIKITSIEKAIERRTIALFIFLKRNWDELTQKGKKKVIKLITESIRIKDTQPAVQIQNQKKVIEALETHNLGQFIKIIKKVKKRAILANPKLIVGIKGLSITRREIFVVKPKETGIAVTQNVKKLEKLLRKK
jgi:phage host-nuclease inhibitor protein Gam